MQLGIKTSVSLFMLMSVEHIENKLLQGLSIQRDRKHCINFADNKNYLEGTVPYLQTL